MLNRTDSHCDKKAFLVSMCSNYTRKFWRCILTTDENPGVNSQCWLLFLKGSGCQNLSVQAADASGRGKEKRKLKFTCDSCNVSLSIPRKHTHWHWKSEWTPQLPENNNLDFLSGLMNHKDFIYQKYVADGKANWCIPRSGQTSSTVRGIRKCYLCSISVGYRNAVRGMYTGCSQGPTFTYTGDVHFAFWNTWAVFTHVTASLTGSLWLLCQCDAVPVLQQSTSVCFNGNWEPTSTLININRAFSQM